MGEICLRKMPWKRPDRTLTNDLTIQIFLPAELEPAEELAPRRVTRILTTEFPQYFAIVTRVRQESATVSPEGGMLSSTVVPQVQAVFPPGALTKKIKMGLQVGRTYSVDCSLASAA